jgi:hypothetical protein
LKFQENWTAILIPVKHWKKFPSVFARYLVSPLFHPPGEKGRPLHSMIPLLIGWMEILFLKLAAIIFGLD